MSGPARIYHQDMEEGAAVFLSGAAHTNANLPGCCLRMLAHVQASQLLHAEF